MSSVEFAACELYAFDFFVKEVLRLFDCAHRVTVQKTVYMARGDRAVVLARFIILRVDTSGNRRIIRKEKYISVLKM